MDDKLELASKNLGKNLLEIAGERHKQKQGQKILAEVEALLGTQRGVNREITRLSKISEFLGKKIEALRENKFSITDRAEIRFNEAKLNKSTADYQRWLEEREHE